MPDKRRDVHEATGEFSRLTRDFYRALASLQEELDAVDWYRQRAECCSDAGLRAVLQHNMREEIEHAAMILEWLRSRDPDFNAQLSIYLATSGPRATAEITASSHDDEADSGVPASEGGRALEPTGASETLTLGSLKHIVDEPH